MNFQEMYRQKLTTPEEAVKVIRSGDWVDYGWSTGTPDVLDKALAARKDELTDVKIRGGVTMWMPEIAKAEERIGALDAEMEANACDYEKLNALVADKDAAQAELDALYLRWEELSEAAGEA